MLKPSSAPIGTVPLYHRGRQQIIRRLMTRISPSPAASTRGTGFQTLTGFCPLPHTSNSPIKSHHTDLPPPGTCMKTTRHAIGLRSTDCWLTFPPEVARPEFQFLLRLLTDPNTLHSSSHLPQPPSRSPGEWAPLRRFFSPPKQVVDENGVRQSMRYEAQPASWFTVATALFGPMGRLPRMGDHMGEDPTENKGGLNKFVSPFAFTRALGWVVMGMLPQSWLQYPYSEQLHVPPSFFHFSHAREEGQMAGGGCWNEQGGEGRHRCV